MPDEISDITDEDVALWHTCTAFFGMPNASFEYSEAEFELRLTGCIDRDFADDRNVLDGYSLDPAKPDHAHTIRN